MISAVSFSFIFNGFDVYYRFISFALNLLAFIFLFIGIYRVKKNPSQMFAKIFVDPKRTISAFVFLFISAIAIAVGYLSTGVVSFYSPGTIIWEYANLVAYFGLMMFAVLFFRFR
ncbi:MAG: hypothetical protein QW292_14795 [Candidatus Parvarchaeota archaeon]